MNNLKMIYFFDDAFNASSGVGKKVLAQIKSFAKFGYEACLVFRYSNNIILFNQNDMSYKTTSFSTTPAYYAKILDIIKKTETKLVYSRKFLLNHFSMDFYKKLNNDIEDVKVIMEFPTIPYDEELSGDALDVIDVDRYYRDKLHHYIKLSTNFSNLDEVFKIRSVKLVNGFDSQKVPMKQIRKENDNKLNLVYVSSMYFWGGVERIISGLRNYYEQSYRKYIVDLYLVGDGSEISLYRKLTEEFGLQNRIFFHGCKTGTELDSIIDQSDIGVCSLGLYKKKAIGGSLIKVAEYLARGLPIIFAFDNYAIPDDYRYALKFDNDPSDIGINEIIKFYDSISQDQDFNSKIRTFAEENLTWDINIKKVIDAINAN